MKIYRQDVNGFIAFVIVMLLFPAIGFLYKGGAENLLIDIPVSIFVIVAGGGIIWSILKTTSKFLEDHYVEKRAKRLNGEEKQRT